MEKIIEGRKVFVNKWGFFKLLETKRRILSIIGVGASEISKLISGEGDTNDESVGDFLGLIMKIINNLDAVNLKWFAETMLSGVTVDGEDMSDNKNADMVLSGSTALFYKIVMFSLEVNYGDFLAMIGLQTNSKS